MTYKHNKNLVSVARMLRKSMTKEERHLWYDYLREYPVRFIRQKIITEYVADFYCAKAKLVIELDGSQHYEKEQIEYDNKRTEAFKNFGIDVIRIPNNEANKIFKGICDYIDDIVKTKIGDM